MNVVLHTETQSAAGRRSVGRAVQVRIKEVTMEYRRFGNTIVARIDQGEDVLEKMKRIAMLEDVKLASVSALGTFSSMTVGIYDLEKRQFMGNDFEGMFEIVSFTGTINTMDGKYYSHIHAAAADAKGMCTADI